MTLFGWLFRSRRRRPVSWLWKPKQQEQDLDDTKNEDLLFQCVQTALLTPPPPPQKRWSTGMLMADLVDIDFLEYEQQQQQLYGQQQQQRMRRRRRRSGRVQSIPPTCGYHFLSAIPEVVDKHSSLSPLTCTEMETHL